MASLHRELKGGGEVNGTKNEEETENLRIRNVI